VPKLRLKWAVAFPNTVRVRSRPTFAYGALYTGSQDGTVYALDAKTGCIRWTFRTTAEVRTPIVVQSTADANGGVPLAFFGDLIGRVYAVDALTGRELWRIKADEHPSATITGSPVYHQGRLYVPVSSLEEAMADPKYPCCTFRGSVLALDARTGKVLWKTYTIDEQPKLIAKHEERRADLVAVGRCDLEHAHSRHEARRALRRHRQQLHGPGERPQQRRARARSEARQGPLVPPGRARATRGTSAA
jgi:outer membrane protein assembly factor BamB